MQHVPLSVVQQAAVPKTPASNKGTPSTENNKRKRRESDIDDATPNTKKEPKTETPSEPQTSRSGRVIKPKKFSEGNLRFLLINVHRKPFHKKFE